MISSSRDDIYKNQFKEDNNLTSIPLTLLKQAQGLPLLSSPYPLQPLSTIFPIPTCCIVTPVIAKGAKRRQNLVLSQSKVRWKKQLVKDIEENDEDGGPISDFVKSSLNWSLGIPQNGSIHPSFPYNFHEHLSHPFPSSHPCVPPSSPPISIGYKTFIERYERLKKIGLVDGSGNWLDSVVEDPVYF